ncbi:UpxY family transcription antiterminator [soil metagenome]
MMTLESTAVPRWYAVHTRSNHEKVVSQALIGREIECFMPVYETVSRWKDRRVLLERPLFPGYVFARIPAEYKSKVATVPSVVNVLCDRPVHDAINEEQVDCLRKELTVRHAEPHKYLSVGHRVSIVRGPFAGMEGILLAHRKANRVVISLPCIVRAFSIEVDLMDVRDNATPISELSNQVASLC